MDRPSVLPAPVVEALRRFAAGRGGRAADLAEAARLVGLLDALPAELAPAAAPEIGRLARLQRFAPRNFESLLARLFDDPAYAARLDSNPPLRWLFLFHFDGYAREAALRRLEGPAPSPFLAAALAHRLNDWVFEVRRAAAGAVARCFPATDPAILAAAALFLLDRGRHWRRWGEEQAVLEEALLRRADVADRLAAEIARRPQGPMARILVSAIRRPALDRHLPALSAGAVQPDVRAAALEALIAGRARWPTGTERRWIDKPMGISKPVAVYSERALANTGPADALIRQGLDDRSPAVRKVALSGLIALGRASEAQLALVRPLAADSNRGVREKAAFVLGQAGAGGPSP